MIRSIPVRKLGILVIVVAAATVALLVLWSRHWDDLASTWPTTLPVCDGFDYPVGAPDAVGYHDAQPFGENDHLGNDWNGNGGGDTDLGDPVYAVAAGIVVEARDIGGDWGNVVRV